MAKTPIFTGSCTAIVTPYLENGVDYEKYAELIDFQYEGGTSAILVCGTTGENPTHTEEEHNKLVELTVKKCAGRMKTIVASAAIIPPTSWSRPSRPKPAARTASSWSRPTITRAHRRA